MDKLYLISFSLYLNERIHERKFNLFYDLCFRHIRSHHNLQVYRRLVDEVNW